MALMVETGAGLPNAESYVSVADCVTYATNHGLAFAGLEDTAAAEAALRRATTYLDNTYRNRFVGYRTNRRAQGLEWPRTGAFYYTPQSGDMPFAGYGYGLYEYDQVEPNVVPPEIVNACCEAAVRELAAAGSLAPDVTQGKIKKSVRVEGAVDVTYAVGVADARSQTPAVQIIDGILGALLSTTGRSPYGGKAVRG